jgi:hypothetical protein
MVEISKKANLRAKILSICSATHKVPSSITYSMNTGVIAQAG